jgi:hypothetical protein
MTDWCGLMAAGGTSFLIGRVRSQFALSAKDVRAGIRVKESGVVPRPATLLTIRHFRHPSECQRMRAGQDDK